MITPKFSIGDQVYKARFDKCETYITCPDCGGTAHVKLILHDGTEVIIECSACDQGGYQRSTGKIKQYEYISFASPYTITGVKVTKEGCSYDLNNFGGAAYWTSDECDLFLTVAEAIEHAEKQRPIIAAEENKRFLAKTRDDKTWKWNATYHRKCIKQAERDLEYHRSKVTICESKVEK